MFDPNLQLRAFRLREQRQLREAQGDRLAHALWKQHTTAGFLSTAWRNAVERFRTRRLRRVRSDAIAEASTRYSAPHVSSEPVPTAPRELVGSGAGTSDDGGPRP